MRLPELPLEVWGPFVFVLADAASAGGVSSVKVQLQAIQVNCSVTIACGDHGRNYSCWRILQDSFENSSGWEGGEVTWRSLKVIHFLIIGFPF